MNILISRKKKKAMKAVAAKIEAMRQRVMEFAATPEGKALWEQKKAEHEKLKAVK